MTDQTPDTVGDDVEDLDERVSTPDDGFPSYDDEDSEAVQAEMDLDAPDGFNPGVADFEGEH